MEERVVIPLLAEACFVIGHVKHSCLDLSAACFFWGAQEA